MAIDGAAGAFLLVGRILFAGVLILMGANHFRNVDALAGYAESEGVPAPRFMVVASAVTLVLGALGILFGLYPTLGAGAVATFFVLVTPAMHDFWAVPDDQRQSELQDFQKNVAQLGAALAFLAISGQEWAYALNVGLF